ncbi:hypothetical protein [Bradyrhizobium sp. LHD-71]|uniref:hypothetical protein n=1 Tax=Bradyrhizobium sp. LHD-71 TaxID=3072141 RepID=UPI00280CFA5D|nr:hypothetical protein [Bradyrhizobium sp. LHD-71]MDQ8726786.1 hypothetical protein [Bradyrhizobium sp. LHD-71]
MRATILFSILLLTGIPPAASAIFAQAGKATKAAPANEARYFTHLEGLMEDRADVVLRDVRQNGETTAAQLDVCFPTLTDANRTDRFVVDLAVSGDKLSGTAQSREGKVPVTVNLIRKRNGSSFDFTGKITIGGQVSEIESTDNSDVSEREFREQQATEDAISATPEDFTEVSPEAIAVKVRRDSVVDFVRRLRGENIQVALYGLLASCAELRSDEQVLRFTVDPERAPALIEKLRAQPEVITAGWTDGNMDMERTIRFPAAEWREAGKISRDKLAAAVSNALATSLPAKVVSSNWNPMSGELKIHLKRPSTILPALGLVESIEITALVSPDRPGASDHLLLWTGSASIETVDESAGPKLNLVENSSGNDEETLTLNDEQMLAALAKQFRGQRWDSETSAWK